ncbi:hypothetical protein JCM24511_07444 [Saitozyma sp. JCM 24511]|nr:hypothetical protein JCM24511_07444 [Saitozyma sp. JCM 24511]
MVGLVALLASLYAATAAHLALTQFPAPCQGYNAFGFANIARGGSANVVANVILQGATPSATCGVRLIQVGPGVSDCGSFTGPFQHELTTDALGNGNLNINEAVIANAKQAFIALNNVDLTRPNDYYNTPLTDI